MPLSKILEAMAGVVNVDVTLPAHISFHIYLEKVQDRQDEIVLDWLATKTHGRDPRTSIDKIRIPLESLHGR